MAVSIKKFRESIRRKAIVMEVGGFRPPTDPKASWFGKVGMSLPGESWPTSEGKPMHALCQLNLTELPYRPVRLEDLELITIFIGPNELPAGGGNGANWCVRAYSKIDQLVPIADCKTGSKIKALGMRPKVIEEDFACWDDVADIVPEEIEEDYQEKFANTPGFKLGGWPTLVQSEIFWAPGQKHPSEPEYVFQIASNEKAGWAWGDGGVGYFGRGTVEGRKDEWALSCQSY